jgi:4-amino-4-deoxychorismate lyase
VTLSMRAPDPALQAVLVNGQGGGTADALVQVLDRGLHFGDGLFETCVCRHGHVRFLQLHLERLARGCERLALAPPEQALLRAEITRLAAREERTLLKLILTRGPATRRGYAPRGDEQPTRILLRYAWPADTPASGTSASAEGVSVRIAALRLGENPALAGIKHLNRLELVLARCEPGAEDAFESLLFSSSGQLVSGSMSNVFIVQAGRVRTPRLDRAGVAGIMRQVVLRAAREANRPIEECALDASDLESAEEVFLTNVRIGICPVRAIGARSLSPGPLTRALQRLIEPLLEGAADA